MSPDVSVVIPCRNDARFLGACIDSVLAQRGVRVECIVVDAASTDGTRALLDRYVAEHGDQVSFTSEPDRGPWDAVNKGWARARGTVLAYLNADDVWVAPDAAATAHRHLAEHPEAVAVFGRCGAIDEDGRLFAMSYARAWDLEYSVTTSDHCIPQPAAFVRRSAVERIGPLPPGILLDRALWLRVGLLGEIHFVPVVLAHARTRSGVSSDGEKMADGAVDAMRDFFRLDSVPAKLRATERRAMSNAHLHGTKLAFHGGRAWGAVARHLKDAVVTDPTNVRKAAGLALYYTADELERRMRAPDAPEALRALASPVRVMRWLRGAPDVARVPRRQNLTGDRDVEWSFIAGRLPSTKMSGHASGHLLDVGGAGGFLALIGAERGYEVTVVDLGPSRRTYEHAKVRHIVGDLLELPLDDETFDVVVCCSTVEHIGLGARYGDTEESNADLAAMKRMRRLLRDGGTLLLTIPVGVDHVFAPMARVYGAHRLPLLLDGFAVEHEEYWLKGDYNRWYPATRADALARPADAGSANAEQVVYGLGCFVLRAHGNEPAQGRR